MTHETYIKAMVAEAKLALKQIGTAANALEIVRAHKRYTTILDMLAIPARLMQEVDPEAARTYREKAGRAIDRMETETMREGVET